MVAKIQQRSAFNPFYFVKGPFGQARGRSFLIARAPKRAQPCGKDQVRSLLRMANLAFAGTKKCRLLNETSPPTPPDPPVPRLANLTSRGFSLASSRFEIAVPRFQKERTPFAGASFCSSFDLGYLEGNALSVTCLHSHSWVAELRPH